MFSERTLRSIRRSLNGPPARCPFCDGAYYRDPPGRRCVPCSRTDDIVMEIRVIRYKQRHEKDFRDWQFYGRYSTESYQRHVPHYDHLPQRYHGVWR